MPPSALNEPFSKVSQRSRNFMEIVTRDDVFDDLFAARRSDTARRAFAAGFDRAKFHAIACHFGHVDGVVEHDDAAVADDGPNRREGFIIERRIELRFGQVRAQGSADLHRLDWTSRCRTAAVIVE